MHYTVNEFNISENTMAKSINIILLLFVTMLSLGACSNNHSPYNDPDGQRERSKDAQRELGRDSSRY